MLLPTQKIHYNAILVELHHLNIRFHPILSKDYDTRFLYEAKDFEHVIKHKVYWYIKWDKFRYVY